MSEEILNADCIENHGSVNDSSTECQNDVIKKGETGKSDATLSKPVLPSENGDMDSGNCVTDSSFVGKDDMKCTGDSSLHNGQKSSVSMKLDISSDRTEDVAGCGLSEGRVDEANKCCPVSNNDADAKCSDLEADHPQVKDKDQTENGCSNRIVSVDTSVSATVSDEHTKGETVLNEKKHANEQEEPILNSSVGRRTSRRCSQSSISSEAGSVGSASGDRKSKRLPTQEQGVNTSGKRKYSKSQDLVNTESSGAKQKESGSVCEEKIIKPKRQYRRKKTNASDNSTATEDSDIEDNITLASLCKQKQSDGSAELKRKHLPGVTSAEYSQQVSRSQKDRSSNGITSKTDHGVLAEENKQQDVVSKFQASQQTVVQGSPQKRMEQLLGQSEKTKLTTPKARKSLPLTSDKKPVKKMPRAKMSLSPNRLSAFTIDSFFKPVDGRVRGRPKAKKSLSRGSKYTTPKRRSGAQTLVKKENCAKGYSADTDTTISSAAATQALSALKTDGDQARDAQSTKKADSCISDAENQPAPVRKSGQVKNTKMPKARKSFPHCKERPPLENNDDMFVHKQNAALSSSQGCSGSLPNSHMTFKIQDLENVFGLKKNLNKLDAKTLDKLVLECALKSKKAIETCSTLGKESNEHHTDEHPGGNSLSSSDCADRTTGHPMDCGTGLPVNQEDVNFASILTSQKILRKRKKKRRSRMGTYNLPYCQKKYKAKKSKQQNLNSQVTSESDDVAPVLEKEATACQSDETSDDRKEENQNSEANVSKSTEEDMASRSCGKKTRKRHYKKRLRYEPKKKIPKYIRARLRDLQKRIHMQCATPEQEEMYYQLESASKMNMHHLLLDAMSRKRKRMFKGDDDTGSIVSTSTSITESETSAHSKEITSQKRRRADDTIPSLSPVTDIPIVNHAYYANSLPPKISPQKVAGVSLLKPLSERAKLKLGKLSPGLECLDAVPDAKKHHIEGASGVDIHLDQGLPPYKFHNTPNGITYPVTPPHTPEHGVSPADAARAEGEENREIQGTDHRSEFIPVCCCKLPGAVMPSTLPGHRTSLYCQALDSVNGKIVGCCSKVTNGQMVRPAHKIPFMVLCEAHRERLKMHQCCPGCGQFCTEGKFLQCKSEVTKKGIVVLHYFHAQCQTYKANKYFCPHCAHESDQFEVSLKYTGSRSSWATVDAQPLGNKRIRADGSKSARMGVLSKVPIHSQTDDITGIEIAVPYTNKTISSKKFPLGPSRSELESAMATLDSDRAKKLRQGSKNLLKACKAGDLEKVIIMLADGANPNLRYEDDHNQSPLHAAAAMGHHFIVHLLLQAGANPHALDNSLATPIILAAEKGNLQILQILVKSGGHIDARRADGMTSLHLAAQSGKVDAVRFLLETRKISVNVKDDGGWTPLIWAAEHSHLDVVHYLLASGADPNIRDNEGNTALHWAAFSGSTDIAEIFLNAGCDLETVNEIGDRPLHIAARQDHYECVVLFLARGADSEARNNDNEAPIGCCIEQNTPTWMALRVNRQLQGFATRKLQQHERLLHRASLLCRDISYGRDATPMPVVNMVDDENYPTDFLYITDYVETTPMNVNRLITSLAACRCKESCGSVFCECSHNSVKCWYEKDGKLVKDFNYSDPPLIFECNKACRCWTSCQNRVVQLGISCRLQVFRTEGRGWGVRTLCDIPQGTFVCEYIGELISDAEADSREDDSYLFDLDNKDTDTYCIDARHYGNISRFINHLCQPNLIPVKVFVDHQDLRFPRICFFASRDIKAYEELGFDYGEKFWIIKWKQFTCTCGSAKCRYSKDTIHKTLEDYNRRQGDDEPVLEQH